MKSATLTTYPLLHHLAFLLHDWRHAFLEGSWSLLHIGRHTPLSCIWHLLQDERHTLPLSDLGVLQEYLRSASQSTIQSYGAFPLVHLALAATLAKPPSQTHLTFAARRQAVVERKAVQVLILKRDRELAERDQQMQELQRQLGKKKGPQGKTTPPKATATEEAEADSPHSRYLSARISEQRAEIGREIPIQEVMASRM